MKKITARERFLLLTPLIIIGFVALGLRLRERFWPTRPRIIECRLRPATPLELSQGAKVGVTAEVVIPVKPFGCEQLDVLFLDGHDHSPRLHKVKGSVVWSESQSEFHGRYHLLQENDALSFNGQGTPSSPGIEVSLRSVCGVFPTLKQRYNLDWHGAPAPDRAAARRPNFRIVRAELMYSEVNGAASMHQTVVLHLSDIIDESQGLISRPEKVGDWRWSDKSASSKPAVRTEAPAGVRYVHDDGTSVEFYVPLKGIRLPPRPGTTLTGLLSVKCGWPQEVTLVWPKSLYNDDWAINPIAFSTRLAPSPAK